jgi:Putative beta-barrel porin-2, OmpL-like. bbp2
VQIRLSKQVPSGIAFVHRSGEIATLSPSSKPEANTDPQLNAAVPTSTQVSSVSQGTAGLSSDTTVNFYFDGYYGYNFNRPVGRVNVLRAFDVMSNSFSLNQAGVVMEHVPNLEAGNRLGGHLDLQYGQATETVQGNAANELRPQVYRPIWQAYGTYVAPVGKGLTLDFGKFASSLGYETNYSKDNFNVSARKSRTQ